MYKLVNEDTGNRTVDKLNLYADICKSTNDISKEKIDALMDEIVVIEHFQDISPDKSLNEYLKYDYLTVKEAVFCLLGLDPNIVDVIKGELIYQALSETKEFRYLMRAEGDGFMSESNGKVFTKGFITWALDKGFIENTNSTSNTGNINTHHNQERALIAEYNKKVTLGEYGSWVPVLGGSKNPSVFVKDTVAFNKLQSKLKLLLKEDVYGNQTMPSKGTIAQYIRDDINSRKTQS
jgi:hypothetical protein